MTAGTVVAIQARTGSSRLPGKVLADLDGIPMLRFQLERLASAQVDRLVVATSVEPGDDAVARLAAEAGVDVVRGPEDDVLGRFALVVETYQPEVLVRLTGDCPLSDPRLVEQVIEVHRAEGADYTSNLFPRSYPKGLDVEAVRPAALLEAATLARAPGEREHVTPYLYRRPEQYRMANVSSGSDLGQEWWVVDTAEDLERVRQIVAELDRPRDAGWREILAAAGTTAAAAPGAVALEVEGGSATGACPWVRSWRAVRDGRDLAVVQVAVGHGEVDRRIEPCGAALDEDDESSISAALDRLLLHDEQIRR